MVLSLLAKTQDTAKVMGPGLQVNSQLVSQFNVPFQTVQSMERPCTQLLHTNLWYLMSVNMDS